MPVNFRRVHLRITAGIRRGCGAQRNQAGLSKLFMQAQNRLRRLDGRKLPDLALQFPIAGPQSIHSTAADTVVYPREADTASDQVNPRLNSNDQFKTTAINYRSPQSAFVRRQAGIKQHVGPAGIWFRGGVLGR